MINVNTWFDLSYMDLLGAVLVTCLSTFKAVVEFKLLVFHVNVVSFVLALSLTGSGNWAAFSGKGQFTMSRYPAISCSCSSIISLMEAKVGRSAGSCFQHCVINSYLRNGINYCVCPATCKWAELATVRCSLSLYSWLQQTCLSRNQQPGTTN